MVRVSINLILTRNWGKKRKKMNEKRERNLLIFLPRGTVMGQEPFQRRRAERKMVALVTKQTSQLCTLSQEHLIYSANAGQNRWLTQMMLSSSSQTSILSTLCFTLVPFKWRANKVHFFVAHNTSRQESCLHLSLFNFLAKK